MVEPRFLLDTNVLSEPLRPQPNVGVLQKLKEHQGLLATTSLVIHELLFGLERLDPSKKKRLIGEYLDELLSSPMPIYPYDLEASRWHSRERARLEKLGRTASFRDSQIGSVAQVRGLVLVTANVAHFQPLSGLAIENWMSS
ncbi:MAG: type II toxin-antitoxin system VapC family toxin [Thermoanaerobaculia bacterium]|nr:type II toxin-antitoxin system VapC family toxin [Thermoanaerobaculia bacterium]